MKIPKKTDIEYSLLEQLISKNKETYYYKDLISDYMYYYDLKKKLKADIKDKGVRYTTVNGNGKTAEKANESIVNLHKTTQMMLKILQDLGLQEPLKENDPNDYY